MKSLRFALFGICALAIVVVADAPALRSIVINEVELNPKGFDRDAEWVELLNVGSAAVDLTGWGLTYNYPSNGVQPLAEGKLSLAPGGRLVVRYEGLRLRNDGATVIALVDATGATIDSTGALRDTSDDERTWQRFPDGGDPLFPDLWVFLPGTPGRTNN